MSRSQFSIEHVKLTVPKGYDAFRAALEPQIGQFEPAAYEALAAGNADLARSRLQSMTGSSGFMLFTKSDHGLVLSLVGKSAKAMQYLLGNPLYAVEMTQHAIGAALYAPLRLLIYEISAAETGVEYDLPSSQFGQFGDPDVDRMARSLDEKLESLVAAAAR